jgi:hypothetical protein
MAGPYTCNDMLIKIDASPVGVVTGTDLRLSREGASIRHVYGSDEGYHVVGGKRATFTLNRWFMTANDTDLLWDIFELELPFALSGEISGVSNSLITISNCRAYTWRPVTGDANSDIGEEITGEGTTWSSTI